MSVSLESNRADAQRVYRYVSDPTGPASIAGLADLVVAGDADTSDKRRAMLDTAAPDDQKRLTLAALLQLLSAQPDAFTQMPVRAWALEFMEAELRRLKALPYEGERANHEREAAFSTLAPTAERSITEAIADLGSTAAIHDARNMLMRRLKHAPTAAAITPFLPAAVVRSNLNELFQALDALAAADASSFQAAHGRALEALDRYREQVNAAGSLAQRLLGAVPTQAGKMIEDAFRSSDAARPATLKLGRTSKKYQLSTPGQEVGLQIMICNDGPGQALDVRLDVVECLGIDAESSAVPVGSVQVGHIVVPLDATVSDGDGAAMLELRCAWRNSDGSRAYVCDTLTFESQRADIDWELLESRKPYDLEPVSTVDALIGRRDILSELRAAASGVPMANSIVTGQKRVGKTSIVKTLATLLSEEDDDLIVVSLETGDYVAPDPAATIAGLGQSMCEAIVEADARFEGLEIPSFDGALNPVARFLGEARRRVKKARFLFILDEFDELPVALFRPGEVGNALFLTLRALGGKEFVGFILVGGEKMGPIVAAQGQALNKFDRHAVDYFDRERHWDDFRELVRSPVREYGFEIDEEAVIALYELTAGHPYFTKLVCREMKRRQVQRRDAHVTVEEIRAAASAAMADAGAQVFAHFWQDGILDTGEKVEDVGVRRAQVLLALAEAMLTGSPDQDRLAGAVAEFGMDQRALRDELDSFVERGVLTRTDGELHCVVPLFERWLRDYGFAEIRRSYADAQAVARYKVRELEWQISAHEIDDVLARWGPYRHRHLTADDIRAWLAQFGDLRSQRLMFSILQGLTFYDGRLMREKLREAHAIVRRGTVHALDRQKRKRADIAVSYLDGPGKSGARCANLYADENNIYAANVVEPTRLPQFLAKHKELQAIVFMDDFVGTGGTAAAGLRDLKARAGRLLEGPKVVFLAMTGFLDGRQRLQDAAEEFDLAVEVHLCDPLSDADRVFSERSRFYDDPGDRAAALEVARAIGTRLDPRRPLGYADSQAAVVFDEGCPNNSLPILWDRRDGWIPLFPRWTVSA